MKSIKTSPSSKYRFVSHTLSLFGAVGLVVSLGSQPAAGQMATVWFRTATGLSTTVSDDQLNRMGYDRFGIVADAQLAYALLPWLDSYGGVAVSAFISSPEKTGGLLAPTAGLMVSTPQNGYRPYAQVDIGLGLTGAIVRPLLRTGLGVDIYLSKEIAFGPTLGYGQLFQSDAPNHSTDARFIWAGCFLFYRYISTEKPQVEKSPKVARRTALRPQIPSKPVEPSPELLELIERTLETSNCGYTPQPCASITSDINTVSDHRIGCELSLDLRQLTSAAQPLPRFECARISLVNEGSDWSRSVSVRLRDLKLVHTEFAISSQTPVVVELEYASLDNVTFSIQGDVTLRINRAVKFEGVRVSSDSEVDRLLNSD